MRDSLAKRSRIAHTCAVCGAFEGNSGFASPEGIYRVPDLPDPVAALIRRAHLVATLLSCSEREVMKHATRHPLIAERVWWPHSIPSVGLLTALTWALEIAKKVVSYCSL